MCFVGREWTLCLELASSQHCVSSSSSFSQPAPGDRWIDRRKSLVIPYDPRRAQVKVLVISLRFAGLQYKQDLAQIFEDGA